MRYAAAVWLLALLGASTPVAAQAADPAIILAAAPQASQQSDTKDKLTPEERMARRFPQPVRVGDLIGLPVLDLDDATIGYIRQVVRTPEGKIQLIVPYWRWLGWVRPGGYLDRYRKLVGVPIETVAILGRQVNALEITRDDFEAAPPWAMEQSIPLGVDDTIKIALGRR